MHIHHVAVWTKDLERLKSFYETYFQAAAGPKYTNLKRKYESYFLSFSSGARLEIMTLPDLQETLLPASSPWIGYTHLAFSVGSEAGVDALTARLQQEGFTLASPPRRTGDGYYESVVLDPDGNRVEITA